MTRARFSCFRLAAAPRARQAPRPRARVSRPAMLLAAAAAALGAPFAAAPAWSQAWDMYQGYTESRVIPYANTLPYHELVSGRHALEVAAHLGSSTAATKFTVDTGSTGIAVSAGLLPDFDAGGVMGWVYYDSSSLLAVGHFTTTEVHYLDGDGNVVATATVPVLGVTRKYCLADAKCQHMVSGDGGGGGGDAGIAMMGVGVNRTSMGVVSETGPLAQYLPETGGYLDSAQAAPVIAALRTAPPIS
ncbi:hypothetical protein ACFFJB_06695 [Camelimonas abortus]|uniref:Uncharacterized protein n=1 Tax=Camelimonas abortus TaxID=1017184 RepID=A0ABV7LH79_9HYPH